MNFLAGRGCEKDEEGRTPVFKLKRWQKPTRTVAPKTRPVTQVTTPGGRLPLSSLQLPLKIKGTKHHEQEAHSGNVSIYR